MESGGKSRIVSGSQEVIGSLPAGRKGIRYAPRKAEGVCRTRAKHNHSAFFFTITLFLILIENIQHTLYFES